jgi:hypothetical protein
MQYNPNKRTYMCQIFAAATVKMRHYVVRYRAAAHQLRQYKHQDM